MRALASLPLAFAAFLTLTATAQARTYSVGSDGEFHTISAVASRLKPGDVVEVVASITDSVVLTRHGTSALPIVIRGITRTSGGRIIRPRIDHSPSAKYTFVCQGDWNIIEGLELPGLEGEMEAEVSAIKHDCDNLLIRNCYIHHHNWKSINGTADAGNITIEFCEFHANGRLIRFHTIDLFSWTKGSTVTVQHCYFHDALGGVLCKSHCPRNIIRYNWFENVLWSAVQIVDRIMEPGTRTARSGTDLYPMHTDIVGNVFFQGWSPGSRYSILQLGGEADNACGTEGDFNISHNLFVQTRATEEPGVAILVHGNVDNIRLYGNAFLSYGVPAFALYERGTVWDTPETADFAKRRADTEPKLSGANNWVSTSVTSIPQELACTMRTYNPRMCNILDLDFRPRADSPLAGSGLWPLPIGAVGSLTPEFEPMRGIPIDLRAPSRQDRPPAIGPFAPAKEHRRSTSETPR